MLHHLELRLHGSTALCLGRHLLAQPCHFLLNLTFGTVCSFPKPFQLYLQFVGATLLVSSCIQDMFELTPCAVQHFFDFTA
jgi:hypothetical protein